ncbi:MULTISPECIES: hypothetical protein [Streptomyces]|uniref:hypothetical protein n=1 Tax=Streptomyces TaxID=1883 RepID=UPI0010203FE0|nr:hypothetical protein [Streptomyces albidoflavus]RZF07991.1 hypothetical protein C0R05_14345 [Streptomyces albidoflavus]
MANSGHASPDVSQRRLGRAVLFLQQQAPMITDNVVRADIGTLLLAGAAMELASRLKGLRRIDSAELVRQFARQSGVPEIQLIGQILPVLKRADVLDYALDSDGNLAHVEEFVGVTGNIIAQTFRVLDTLGPRNEELALLHSIEIASWAPLTKTQHLDQIVRRGLTEAEAESGFKYSVAVAINRRINSTELNEQVVFNPHVWGTGQVQIASFLRDLPPNERDALLGICEVSTKRPGTTLERVGGDSAIVSSARKVGLIQAATVKSSAGGTNLSQTYVFSPLIQTDDDQATTTEALHLRKLFLAHILFGQEKAQLGLGRISDPVAIVRKLLNTGSVGPATNIRTDYHMLEAHGVVRVEESAGGRAFLKLIKEDIVRDGLDWLNASLGNVPGGSANVPKLEHVPGIFIHPERDRSMLPDDAASHEIVSSAVLELRKEAQRAVRHQSPFGR